MFNLEYAILISSPVVHPIRWFKSVKDSNIKPGKLQLVIDTFFFLTFSISPSDMAMFWGCFVGVVVVL